MLFMLASKELLIGCDAKGAAEKSFACLLGYRGLYGEMFVVMYFFWKQVGHAQDFMPEIYPVKTLD